MIDRARWLDALKENAFERAGEEGETAGFHIPQLGSLVLHEEGQAASLMRLVCEDVVRDAEELTTRAQRLEEYACKLALQGEREGGAEGGYLPLYASATPSGRLVANFCACSPFDETDEALMTLHRFLNDNPLSCETVR